MKTNMAKSLEELKREREALVKENNALNERRNQIVQRLMELNGIIKYLEEESGGGKVE